MSRNTTAVLIAAFSFLCYGASASAETLRCQSINGNLNCAGSSGASCQTVNGRTTCVSGHGDVVQSFGGGGAAPDLGDEGADYQDRDEQADRPGSTTPRRGEKRYPRSDWFSLDAD
jgi:hypothetical protein